MLNKTSLVAEFVLENKGDIVFRLIFPDVCKVGRGEEARGMRAPTCRALSK